MLRISHSSFGSHWAGSSLVADGRLTTPSGTGWQVRVLSPVGIDLVRAEVVATGLFAESREVQPERRPDAGAECIPDLGLTFGTAIELATEEGPVSVSWWIGEGPADCYVPSAAREELNALLARLESMEDWLPAQAWTDAALRPYVPDAFRLFTIAQPWQPGFGQQPEVGRVVWPLAGTVGSHGEPISALGWPDWTVRCAVVSNSGAASIIEALTDAGVATSDSTPPGFASGALLHDRSNESAVAIVLEALPPDQAECPNADLRFLNCWAVNGVQPFFCAAP